ncbi:hypothetical protein HME9304_01789 [Flagellimonas maritima]|uniref:TrbC/VirB2 family protein n=1 Tax=Flagellimonas maritima TaxID=1383885 RepID=A0A2Z4LT73_9FLAO|nr:hypothetical protein [Allomuricauda aurantiaca]AWX44784.1 hypothetical protein HME9304_01789 [Allomuricauda aurantiaca]
MKNVKGLLPKTRQIFLGAFLLASTPIFAMVDLGIKEAAQNLLDEVKDSAPVIIGLIFLVAALFNIGKITGGDRDYKGFFISIGLWILGVVMVGAIFNFLVGYNF